MIRVSELSGAWLDYWVARAEGIPAERLEVRPVPRTDGFVCVDAPTPEMRNARPQAMSYSSDWTMAGPLLLKWRCSLFYIARLEWASFTGGEIRAVGDSPMVAICRSIVRDAFGEEVPEVAPC